MTTPIRHLTHDQIDRSKWDACILRSVNGSVYAWTWYLDAVSPGWEALVQGDYSAIMPLTYRKKWGIPYLFRPLLNQHLGVFSPDFNRTRLVEDFLSVIPDRFRLIEITLNKYNKPPTSLFKVSSHTSYELALASDYENLRRSYHKNTERNLRKSEQAGLQIDLNLSAEEFLGLLWHDSSAGSAILRKKQNPDILVNLMRAMKEHGAGRIVGVRDQGGEMLAATLFGYSHRKWVYLVPLSTEKGKQAMAQFAIIDALIQENAGSDALLDFEGSDIQGVARFYAGFGAQAYHYTFISRDRLPLPLKMVKSLKH